jgi:putative DNA primase/helicase
VATVLSPTVVRMTDARTVCDALGGHWYGQYGRAFCPAHPNTKTPALSVKDGDDGKLLVYCHTGCGGVDVLAALRAQGLLEGHSDWKPNPQVAEQRKIEKEAIDCRRTDTARRCWSECSPISGTLAERYLRARGITCHLPPTLRFHPSCWHGPTASKAPAMVAAVSIRRMVVGVHRTYLAEPGIKAFEGKERLMLGPCRGGAVHLGLAGEVLMVGEGIETCLAAMQATGRPTWAALSTAGLLALDLPDMIRQVIVLADGDEAGEAAARNCARRWTEEGRRVRIARPPRGMDFNDMLRRGSALPRDGMV